MIYSIIREGFEEFYAKEFSRMVKNYIRHIEEESLITIEHNINFDKKKEESIYTVDIPEAVVKKLRSDEAIPDMQIILNDITGLGFIDPTPNVNGLVSLHKKANYSSDAYTVTIYQYDNKFSITFKKHENIIENTKFI